MRTMTVDHHLLFHLHSVQQSMAEASPLHVHPDRPPPVLHPEYHHHLVQTERVAPAIARTATDPFVIILRNPIQHIPPPLLPIFPLTIQTILQPPLPIILPNLTQMLLSRRDWTPSLLLACHSPSLQPPDQSAPTTVRLLLLVTKVMKAQNQFVKKVTEEDRHTAMNMSVIVVETIKKELQKKLPEEVRARRGLENSKWHVHDFCFCKFL